MLDLLYEDKHLIICIKPVGILSQPDTGEGDDMQRRRRAYDFF